MTCQNQPSGQFQAGESEAERVKKLEELRQLLEGQALLDTGKLEKLLSERVNLQNVNLLPESVDLLGIGRYGQDPIEGEFWYHNEDFQLGTVTWLRMGPNRTYDVQFRARISLNEPGVDVSGEWPTWEQGFYVYTQAGKYLGKIATTVIDDTWGLADGWKTGQVKVSTATVFATYPSGVYLRGYIERTGGKTSTSQVAWVKLEDATQATAAATSAESSETSATDAGNFATAASVSETNAATSAFNAAGDAINAAGSSSAASTSAGQASTSETNAAGSAASALTYSNNAASSQDAAGNSATAAANSASSASTSANASGVSAAASEVSRIAAAAANVSATAQAGIATSKAVEANNSAASAAISESLSSAFAITSGITPNSHFDTGHETFNFSIGGPVDSLPALSVEADWNGAANVLVSDTYQPTVATKRIAYDPTRTYALRYRVRQEVAATIRQSFISYQATGWASRANVQYASINPGVDTWYEGEVILDHALVPAGTLEIAGYLIIHVSGGAGESGLDYLYLEDVTESATAQAQADIATTKATEASVDAAAASVSESLTADYRDDAKVIRVTGPILPSDFNANGEFWTVGTSLWSSPPYTFVTPSPPLTGILSYITTSNRRALRLQNIVGTFVDVAAQGWITIEAGKTYEISVESSTNGTGITLYGLLLSNTGSYISNSSSTPAGQGGSFTTYKLRLDGTALLATGATKLRPMVRVPVGTAVTMLSKISIADVTTVVASEAQAVISTAQAVIATAAQAAASSSATLAASLGVASLNANSRFAAYTTTPGPPDSWIMFAGTAYREAGKGSSPYSVRLPGLAGANAGIRFAGTHTSPYRGMIRPNEWYRVVYEFTLTAGTLVGAGGYAILTHIDTSASVATTNAIMSFSTMPDVNGIIHGNGVVGRTYRFETLVKATDPNVGNFNLYGMSHWTSTGSIAAANELTWHECSISPASGADAAVRTSAGVLVDVAGRMNAYLNHIVEAGTNRSIFSLAADNYGSSAALIADQIALGDKDKVALSLSGGNALFTGELNVGASSGSRVNITQNLIRIFDTSVLRVKIGDLSA